MRRANGTGTVVKLGGKRTRPYAVKVAGRDSRGYVVQKYLSYHRTNAEAQAALEDYNRQEAHPAIESYDKTLNDVYGVWSMRRYARAGSASVSSHKAAWNRLSVIGDMKMRQIGIDDWQGIVDSAEAAGLSQSSVNNIIGLIHALSHFAMERDIIVKDYSQFVKAPSIAPKMEKGAFSDIQMARLYQLTADGFPWADTVLMLCYTGFRINEFLSLTPFNYHEDSVDGGYFVGGSKTEAGKNRVVPVHSRIAPILRRWLSLRGETIVCRDCKRISAQWYREKAFAPVAEAIGVPQATPHWCRHTFATLLNNAGVPELERKRLLGHADKNVTEHYTHSDIKRLADWLQKVA